MAPTRELSANPFLSLPPPPPHMHRDRRIIPTLLFKTGGAFHHQAPPFCPVDPSALRTRPKIRVQSPTVATAAGRWWLQLEASGALRVQLFPGRQAQTAIRDGERRDAAAWGLRPYFRGDADGRSSGREDSELERSIARRGGRDGDRELKKRMNGALRRGGQRGRQGNADKVGGEGSDRGQKGAGEGRNWGKEERHGRRGSRDDEVAFTRAVDGCAEAKLMELLNRKQNEEALKQFRAAPDVHATLSAEVYIRLCGHACVRTQLLALSAAVRRTLMRAAKVCMRVCTCARMYVRVCIHRSTTG